MAFAGLPARAGLLLALGTVLLCAGYLSGRSAASPRGFLADGRAGAPPPPHLPSPSDFNAARLTDATLARLKAASAAAAGRPISSLLTADGLLAHQSGTAELHASVAAALGELSASFDPSQHGKLLNALVLIAAADERVHDTLQAILPVAADRLSPKAKVEDTAVPETAKRPKTLQLSVTVAQKPFGMHIQRGTTRVEEVFPGFPAQAAGVRKGCELLEVAGQKVSSGSWLEVFQKSTVPFAVKLACGGTPPDGGSLSHDEHRYRVMVTKKPYGMNVQVNKVPRVIEVLPGFPAEAAGVRRGFVLTEVNDVAVDAETWFEEYQSAQLPFTLTFDTKVPVQPDNPYFNNEQEQRTPEEGGPTEGLHGANNTEDEPFPGEGYSDFRCTIEALPFGMHVSAPPHSLPRVVAVVHGTTAERAGVLTGDVLVEVAGRRVTWSTWFASMQQAVTPYGLLFRRPNVTTTMTASIPER